MAPLRLVSLLSTLCLTVFRSGDAKSLRILVLGGTGFVGSNFISKALENGHSIVSVSRRGKPSQQPDRPAKNSPKWIQADILRHNSLLDVLTEEEPFDVYVHTIGLLFDSSSGLLSLNKYASGSGSVPATDATYDKMTRQTAFQLMDYALYQHANKSSVPTVLFVSAAEAGWKFTCPVSWLERYLIAKRAVESRLLGLLEEEKLRSVIFRPSLIWTKERPQGLLSVIPFTIANSLLERVGVEGLVDRPVKVDGLAKAMLAAAEKGEIKGVQRFREIDSLAKST